MTYTDISDEGVISSQVAQDNTGEYGLYIVPDGSEICITEDELRAALEQIEIEKGVEPRGQSLSGWFGLSYASWLTLPRVLMEHMPAEWQKRMAKLLHEYDEAHDFMHLNFETHVTLKEANRFRKTPNWLINYRRPDRDAVMAVWSEERKREHANQERVVQDSPVR